jgi:hypothetical protein
MRLLVAIVLCLAIACASAQTPALGASDTIQSMVSTQKGKRVTLRLRSGQELTGTLRESTDRLAVLTELAGRELFEAVVPIEAIEAVIVRTKQ